eukprot:TRINITY_DN14345_c0_g1_i1.p1 TRINITY_DN14345_c0_g1~~TRINITY_DN14345_c0_g1_i1.p1  ORF type:complete len:541 (+),score=119.01 TRINITY_DN14345_c0_g1_i1:43-1665(+)
MDLNEFKKRVLGFSRENKDEQNLMKKEENLKRYTAVYNQMTRPNVPKYRSMEPGHHRPRTIQKQITNSNSAPVSRSMNSNGNGISQSISSRLERLNTPQCIEQPKKCRLPAPLTRKRGRDSLSGDKTSESKKPSFQIATDMFSDQPPPKRVNDGKNHLHMPRKGVEGTLKSNGKGNSTEEGSLVDTGDIELDELINKLISSDIWKFGKTPQAIAMATDVMNFSRIGAGSKKAKDKKKKGHKMIELSDIAGLQHVKTAFRETIGFYALNPAIYQDKLGKPPNGFLLFGPPGTGKTLLGKALASSINARFFSVSSSGLLSKWMGESEKLVQALFMAGKVFEPSMIFMDEIDSLLTQRASGEQETTRRIKNELFICMNGNNDLAGDVFVIGATNRPQELDEAARRRFALRLYVPLPCYDARLFQLNKELNECDARINLSPTEFEEAARALKGFSGSDIFQVCQAARRACISKLVAALPKNSSMEDINQHIRSIGKDDLVITYADVQKAIETGARTVADKDVVELDEWNKKYGSDKTSLSLGID